MINSIKPGKYHVIKTYTVKIPSIDPLYCLTVTPLTCCYLLIMSVVAYTSVSLVLFYNMSIRITVIHTTTVLFVLYIFVIMR